MKTLEVEIQAENGIVKLPADMQDYHNAKVRVTLFVEEIAKKEVAKEVAKEEIQNEEIPQPVAPPSFQSMGERYSKYIDTPNLDVALEGLLSVATAISKLNKEQESLQDKAQIDVKIKEISELEYIKTQIQEVVSRLKMQHEMQQAVEKTVSSKMADSSETINTIERMKNKITENELLGSIYEKFKNSKDIDPEIERKINEVLDMDAQKKKAALDELKKKMGIV